MSKESKLITHNSLRSLRDLILITDEKNGRIELIENDGNQLSKVSLNRNECRDFYNILQDFLK